MRTWKKFTNKPYVEALSDFHLLLWLAEQPNLDLTTRSLSATGAVKEKSPVPEEISSSSTQSRKYEEFAAGKALVMDVHIWMHMDTSPCMLQRIMQDRRESAAD